MSAYEGSKMQEDNEHRKAQVERKHGKKEFYKQNRELREQRYRDRNGQPITLDGLCTLEPQWAANRIRTLEGEFEEACADSDTWRERYRRVTEQCKLWRKAANELDRYISLLEDGEDPGVSAVEAVEQACDKALDFDKVYGVEE